MVRIHTITTALLFAVSAAAATGKPPHAKHRVIVSTDIGGTDFDDEIAEVPTAVMQVGNHRLEGYAAPDRTLCFRCCPKSVKTFNYTIHSNLHSLDGKTAKIVAIKPAVK